ncbi:MAG: helix-turn-helix transcriptional regulator [Deltaproteobacteria bacterium]|nr:helix-turn-helix transcriptional regulator [Deltaproteobacteria bacterium]
MRNVANDLRKELGEKIRGLRKAAGLTQEELDEKTGLSYKFIGELERGQVNVSLDSLVKITEALGVQMGSLFDREKPTVQKVFVKEIVKEKGSSLRFSQKDISLIKKAIRILNQVKKSKSLHK